MLYFEQITVGQTYDVQWGGPKQTDTAVILASGTWTEMRNQLKRPSKSQENTQAPAKTVQGPANHVQVQVKRKSRALNQV